eukprot:4794200-Lingulodinium_polyedra.AAC.1
MVPWAAAQGLGCSHVAAHPPLGPQVGLLRSPYHQPPLEPLHVRQHLPARPPVPALSRCFGHRLLDQPRGLPLPPVGRWPWSLEGVGGGLQQPSTPLDQEGQAHKDLVESTRHRGGGRGVEPLEAGTEAHQWLEPLP